MSDKIYCGSGDTISSEYGEFYSITVDLETLYKASKDGFGFTAKGSGKKFLKLNLNKRREPGKYGETHSLTVDTWKPDQLSSNTGQVKKVFQDDIPGSNPDSIPF